MSTTLFRNNDSPMSYLKNTQYNVFDNSSVSEAIGNDWLYKWTPKTPVFISAQTGSGKNYFIENTLVPAILEHNQNTSFLPEKILILSNRIALGRQTKQRLAEKIDFLTDRHDKKYVPELENYSDKGFDNYFDFGNIKICSYQSLLGNQDLLNDKYAFVIIDECHFFFSDAKFNHITEHILQTITTRFKNSIRIYMSATLDDVIPCIIKKECLPNIASITDNSQIPLFANDADFTLDNPNTPLALYVKQVSLPFLFSKFCEKHIANNKDIYYSFPFPFSLPQISFRVGIPTPNFYFNLDLDSDSPNTFVSYSHNNKTIPLTPLYNKKNAVIYDITRNYDYIQPKYFSFSSSSKKNNENNKDNALHQYCPILGIIKTTLIEKPKEKWIVFVPSKKAGEFLKNELNKEAENTATFISMESKYSSNNHQDAIDADNYTQIVKTETFPAKVLISTSVIENGVNISDTAVKHIVIFLFDRTQFLQMLGRLRIDKTNRIQVNLYIPAYSSTYLKKIFSTKRRILNDLTDFDTMDPRERRNFHDRLIQQDSHIKNIFGLKKNEKLMYNHLAKINLLNESKFLEKIISKQPGTEPSLISDENIHIPESWNNLKPKELAQQLSDLEKSRNGNLSEDNPHLSFTDYSYLKKYEFFSNEIDKIETILTTNPPLKDLEDLQEKKTILISEQEKYRSIFNHKSQKYDATIDVTIIEQLVWIEQIASFNMKNYCSSPIQKQQVQQTKDSIEELIHFLDENAQPESKFKLQVDKKKIYLDYGMDSIKQNTFKNKFESLYKNAYGKRPEDKTKSAPYSLNKINKCLTDKSPDYHIEKSSFAVITQKKSTYWLLLKE
ncbi:Helicase conserved C-terminal domain-containing protein [Propionispira arboris]|uniref:Helicase conserved C-terminal domain-containing protein n=1 Tax=Propionispira arboris TaxID=84035 RepID=A0A1H6ZY49_9FIRM|nr:DEAD/DEAH box helicase family protein [Propionispira arboris]SEJ54652.1 Helicase conserved C-terminal domain-containing protein [Propionispira arboris]